ncbi:MAG: polysaccharide deacetylase family protein, partial [Deinococcales bacterium]|nr:polysaccharide deacetylase family protein [Chitinophagaceae bacterium]
QYTANFIQSIIGEELIITTIKEQFAQSNKCKINYSNKPICKDEYRIHSHTLLFQNNIENVAIEVGGCRNNPSFFITQNDSHGFDILAATFYLISRYEEYLPHEKDSYGRYTHTNSLAYKYNFLHLPLVNIWLQDLMQRLQTSKNGQRTTINSQRFTFTPTYDIDIAYAHQHQSIFKNIGGFFKDLMRGDIEKVIERANVYSGKVKDPFDVYEWLDGLHKKHQLQPIYFFLLAKKRSVYDKNVPPIFTGIRQLIKHHQGKYKVGIHPSWQSGDDEMLLQKEKLTLENITQTSCIKSRQHYIRLSLPETYSKLIAIGITDEYSMGFGSINGFRASVASPFYWFNLATNESTNLLIHPFCWMDANSYFEQHLSPNEAAVELQQYYNVVKQVGGNFTIILHNNFLTEQPQWLPWRKMYEAFLSMIE